MASPVRQTLRTGTIRNTFVPIKNRVIPGIRHGQQKIFERLPGFAHQFLPQDAPVLFLHRNAALPRPPLQPPDDIFLQISHNKLSHAPIIRYH